MLGWQGSLEAVHGQLPQRMLALLKQDLELAS